MSTRAWHSPRQTGRNELADMETVMSCQPVDCWLVLRLKQQVLPSVQHGVPWRLWTSFGPSSSDDDRMNMAGTHRFRRFSQDAATNYRGREKPNPQFHVALSIRLCPHLPQLHLAFPDSSSCPSNTSVKTALRVGTNLTSQQALVSFCFFFLFLLCYLNTKINVFQNGSYKGFTNQFNKSFGFLFWTFFISYVFQHLSKSDQEEIET
jgi:hypothetical protein